MAFAKTLGKTALALGSFGAGFLICLHPWPPSKDSDPRKMSERNKETLELFNSVQKSHVFQDLINDPRYRMLISSDLIPEAHRANHVGLGLMNSPNRLDVGPLVFINEQKGKMYSFVQLGDNMLGSDGKIHNGVISTLMDESLCFCGFPKLPSKRGVTARLTIDYHKKVTPNTMVMLVAKVREVHGRRCTIDGHVETFTGGDKSIVPERIAEGECILVEPKWFKYFSWVDVFS